MKLVAFCAKPSLFWQTCKVDLKEVRFVKLFSNKTTAAQSAINPKKNPRLELARIWNRQTDQLDKKTRQLAISLQFQKDCAMFSNITMTAPSRQHQPAFLNKQRSTNSDTVKN